ncbi:MAG TPA: M48 family metalloprotease [Motiliproteus sp.]
MAARIAIVAALSLFGGCATPAFQPPSEPKALRVLEQEHQQQLALAQHHADQNRLARIALPLQRAAAELCPQPPQAALGIRLSNQHFYPESLRNAAIRYWQLGDVLQVTSTLPGGAAAEAGVEVGDYLVQLDQQPLPTGESATYSLNPLLAKLQPQQPVALQVIRAGQPRQLTLTPQAVCRYPLLLIDSDKVNAYATHTHIKVTRGLLRFAAGDWELAFVIAHEMAHNLRGHVPAQLSNGASGALIDLWLIANGIPSPGLFTLGSTHLHSKGFEREADYLALYLMARAGFSLEHNSVYWRRVAANHPPRGDEPAGSTHPSLSERYLAMQRTLAEIKEKQQHNRPLLPEHFTEKP